MAAYNKILVVEISATSGLKRMNTVVIMQSFLGG